MRGKGIHRGQQVARNQDHPRLCGEKQVEMVDADTLKGSPPPMRGKVRRSPKRQCESRITPAYAGKSCQWSRHFPACRDHPRLCGEKQENAQPESVWKGSPPPMRGKAARMCKWACVLGITPAYAGKRNSTNFNRRFCKDHPRLCGEK